MRLALKLLEYFECVCRNVFIILASQVSLQHWQQAIAAVYKYSAQQGVVACVEVTIRSSFGMAQPTAYSMFMIHHSVLI